MIWFVHIPFLSEEQCDKLLEQIKADMADKEQLQQLGEINANKNKKTS